jgi:hypothetical protein
VTTENGQPFETCSVHVLNNLESRPDSGAPVQKPCAFDQNALVARALVDAANALLAAVRAISPLLTASNPAQPPGDFAAVTQPGLVTSRASPLPAQNGFDASLTVGETINFFLKRKAAMGKTDETLRYLTTCLKSFGKGRWNQPVQTVTADELQTWIDGFDRTKTKKTYLGAVKTFMRWAVKKNLLAQDLTGCVEIPEDDDDEGEPDPYTPEEAKKILEHLIVVNPDLCRVMAIRFFAGLRTSEAQRGDDSRILPSGYIEVRRDMTKTKRRRLVTVLPNLKAWLELGGEWRSFAQDTIRQEIKEAGVTPRRNGTRSAFITYHEAKFEDVNKTAKQAGNSKDMIETRYKGLATKEQAEAYFTIFPPESRPEVKLRENPGWFKKNDPRRIIVTLIDEKKPPEAENLGR